MGTLLSSRGGKGGRGKKDKVVLRRDKEKEAYILERGKGKRGEGKW